MTHCHADSTRTECAGVALERPIMGPLNVSGVASCTPTTCPPGPPRQPSSGCIPYGCRVAACGCSGSRGSCWGVDFQDGIALIQRGHSFGEPAPPSNERCTFDAKLRCCAQSRAASVAHKQAGSRRGARAARQERVPRGRVGSDHLLRFGCAPDLHGLGRRRGPRPDPGRFRYAVRRAPPLAPGLPRPPCAPPCAPRDTPRAPPPRLKACGGVGGRGAAAERGRGADEPPGALAARHHHQRARRRPRLRARRAAGAFGHPRAQTPSKRAQLTGWRGPQL